MFASKKTIFLIIGLVVLIGILLSVILTRPQQGPPKPPVPIAPSVSPSITPIKISPKEITTAPALPPDRGQGLDIEANAIKESVNEINKISPLLSYTNKVKLSTNLEVEILIPPTKYQSNPWTLSVQISGINFNVTPEEPEYEQMKKSFVEASSFVFGWIKSNGADPQKIYYSWGEKEFIQVRAEEWLKSQ